jgi:hypothetical protein
MPPSSMTGGPANTGVALDATTVFKLDGTPGE